MTTASPLPELNPAAGRKRLLIRVAKIVVLGIVFVCLYLAVRADLAKADEKVWAQLDVNWLLVIGATLCLAGMNTVQMIRYRSLLFAYGAQPTWRQMAAIAWIPPLGKYVPGSVWSLMGAIAMLRRFGVNAAIAISVVLMVDAFSQIVGFVFSVPLLMRPPISEQMPLLRWAAPPMLILGILIIAPPIFNRLLAFALRVLKRPPLDHMPGWGEYVVPILSAVAQWLFAGGALWLMTRAVTPISIERLPHFVMIASCAMAVGYMFFLLPAGFGVRELIFVIMLEPMLDHAPAGTIAIVTIAMRLAQIAAELTLAGLGAWMLRYERAEPMDALGDAEPTSS